MAENFPNLMKRKKNHRFKNLKKFQANNKYYF